MQQAISFYRDDCWQAFSLQRLDVFIAPDKVALQ
jgi:hypothetical protein